MDLISILFLVYSVSLFLFKACIIFWHLFALVLYYFTRWTFLGFRSFAIAIRVHFFNRTILELLLFWLFSWQSWTTIHINFSTLTQNLILLFASFFVRTYEVSLLLWIRYLNTQWLSIMFLLHHSFLIRRRFSISHHWLVVVEYHLFAYLFWVFDG